MANTAIFLGGGASAAEGAPLQNDLFKEYFKSLRENESSHNYEMQRELASFFAFIFNIDVDNSSLENVQFPTFEECLGIIDLAERRKESLKGFELENMASNSDRLRFIRLYLIMLMAKIIDDKLKESKGYHKSLVEKLKEINYLKNTIFISTNYDILIDNALTYIHLPNQETQLDYGVDFTNFRKPNDWTRPGLNAIKLYKLHGSLNWLYCPTCNELTLTPLEKGVVRKLMYDFSEASCENCESVIVPIIVPPTFFKDMNNVYLSIIWNKAELALREVEHIIFCGYSFPDADMHIKYLLKRIQTNRNNPIKITVCNNHSCKKEIIAQEEELRFKRFLGVNVNYTNYSFQDFVNNIEQFYVEQN